MKETIRGGITAPLGFKANGIFCGIKKSKKRDLMMIASESPCVTAGVFTTNQLKAACVQHNIKQLARTNQAQAILANSGNANCLTGPAGKRHNALMAVSAAKALGISPALVLTASTGVIGQRRRRFLASRWGGLGEGTSLWGGEGRRANAGRGTGSHSIRYLPLTVPDAPAPSARLRSNARSFLPSRPVSSMRLESCSG